MTAFREIFPCRKDKIGRVKVHVAVEVKAFRPRQHHAVTGKADDVAAARELASKKDVVLTQALNLLKGLQIMQK